MSEVKEVRGAKVEVKCKGCGKLFMARVADRKRGWGKHCSKSCKAKVQEGRTGQYARYLRGDGSSDHDDQIEVECGWDGHKNVF